jgi:hypothetical protein
MRQPPRVHDYSLDFDFNPETDRDGDRRRLCASRLSSGDLLVSLLLDRPPS